MRVYKVVEIQFYNKLMDIYRQQCSKAENNTVSFNDNKASEQHQEEVQQLGGDKPPFWTSFEQTIEQVRQSQKEQKKRRKSE